MFRFKILLVFALIAGFSAFAGGDYSDTTEITFDDFIKPKRFNFPILLMESQESSLEEYTKAANLFFSTHVSRQGYLSRLSELNENYYYDRMYYDKEIDSKTKTPKEIYAVTVPLLKTIIEEYVAARAIPPMIDSLYMYDAFLGMDHVDELNAELGKKAQPFVSDAALLGATKTLPTAENSVSTDGDLNKARYKEIKMSYHDKILARDAIYIDTQFKSPVFLNAALWNEVIEEDTRVFNLAFQWMIFANAYPTAYKNVSPKVIDMIRGNNWRALYKFSFENLHPSMFPVEIDKYLRVANF